MGNKSYMDVTKFTYVSSIVIIRLGSTHLGRQRPEGCESSICMQVAYACSRNPSVLR